jgi:chemotaxis regulatin CheY-phosphate phosphatase CheZ
MSKSRIADVLYDSETMLRLVDSELEELKDDADGCDLAGNQVGVLLAVMQRASSEIAQVLCTLHTSREALEGVTLQEIHDSASKLREVSTATEIAATRMMDGLERAHTLVDRLDELDAATSGENHGAEATHVREKLRDELFAAMGSLQFQDITSQQLGHVSQMLGDIERRLHAASSLLSGGCGEATGISAEQFPTFSESASTRNSFERQAAADVIFWGGQASRITQ